MVNRKSANNSLRHTEGRVIVRVWLEEKNYHTFSNGITIRHERQFDSFERRHTEPVQGTVISGENIPEGAIILFHHNSIHGVNELFNTGQLSGDEIASQIKLYSIPEVECYAWKKPNEEWQPTKGFAFALRIFKPYNGPIHGIKPEKIKNVLWCTTGEYVGKAMHTLVACDYAVIFREPSTGQESSLIRCRPDGDEKAQREPEFVCINHGITNKVLNGEYLIGLSPEDAKTVSQIKADELISKKKPKGKLLNLDSHA